MKREYFGIKLRQRKSKGSPSLFYFYANAKEILTWATIRRTHEREDGTQRIFRPSRLTAIRRFLDSDKDNTIPGAILLAFEPKMACFRKIDIAAPKKVANQKGYDLRNGCKKKVEFGLLSFEIDPGGPEEDKPALVVDGQHRLLGIGSYGKEDIPIFIACLLDADLAEQAFQFIVINNKAVRVSADNVKSIIARQYDEPKLNERLEKSGVRYGQAVSFLKEANEDKRSPFAKILDWEFNKDESSKIVPITAVEACVRMIRARFEMLQEDQDSLLSLLYAIWAPVKKSYSGLWAKDSKLMTKVCITTLNEFLVDRLHFNWEEGNVDIFESKEVSECVESMVQKIPTQFWESEWNILIQDNANIRKIIKDDLTRIVSNLRQKKVWSEGAVVLAQHEDD